MSQNTTLMASNMAPTDNQVVHYSIDEKKKLVKSMIAPSAKLTDTELDFYFYRCGQLGIDPLSKLLHPVKYGKGEDATLTFQPGIDLLRMQAESTGEYDGQDPPVYQFDNQGKPFSCTVTVYSKGKSRGIPATAFYDEYVQTKAVWKNKKYCGEEPTKFWKQMPKLMLAKCAEALALRKAFPQKLNGFYIPEEMGQAENEEGAGSKPAKPVADGGNGASDRNNGSAPVPSSQSEIKIKPLLPAPFEHEGITHPKNKPLDKLPEEALRSYLANLSVEELRDLFPNMPKHLRKVVTQVANSKTGPEKINYHVLREKYFIFEEGLELKEMPRAKTFEWNGKEITKGLYSYLAKKENDQAVPAEIKAIKEAIKHREKKAAAPLQHLRQVAATILGKGFSDTSVEFQLDQARAYTKEATEKVDIFEEKDLNDLAAIIDSHNLASKTKEPLEKILDQVMGIKAEKLPIPTTEELMEGGHI